MYANILIFTGDSEAVSKPRKRERERESSAKNKMIVHKGKGIFQVGNMNVYWDMVLKRWYEKSEKIEKKMDARY